MPLLGTGVGTERILDQDGETGLVRPGAGPIPKAIRRSKAEVVGWFSSMNSVPRLRAIPPSLTSAFLAWPTIRSRTSPKVSVLSAILHIVETELARVNPNARR